MPVESDAESDSSDRIPVPSFQNSFSQAIEAALLKLDKPSTADHLSGEEGRLLKILKQEKISISPFGRRKRSNFGDQKSAAEQV